MELTLPELDLAVHPRDSLVVEANIALRAPTNFHHLAPWSNHIDSAFSDIFLYLLKDQVRLFGSFKLHEVDFSTVNHNFVGQGLLTQFALEFSKTVDRDQPVVCSGDFVLQPSHQTAQMDKLT
jgi:hypothetical protein